jgi:hypothetical protein
MMAKTKSIGAFTVHQSLVAQTVNLRLTKRIENLLVSLEKMAKKFKKGVLQERQLIQFNVRPIILLKLVIQ